MVKTLRDISFSIFLHIGNAGMKGFRNKIRWLIRQAYRFRDSEYFKLKICRLSEISSAEELRFMVKPLEEENFERKNGGGRWIRSINFTLKIV